MGKFGLYLHIPFCDGKCNYCNFFSRTADRSEMDEYVKHLNNAILSWGKRLDRTVDTVYFGGGTPSLLGHASLISILNTVYSAFTVADDAEITVEVNPSSTDSLDFAAMREAGFNRLSIGLQSTNPFELKLLGRRHSAEDAKNTVAAAQKAGFDNISLDVMLATLEQTIDSLHTTLDFCAECQVQHISAYILKIEPKTCFYRERKNLPFYDEDTQAAFYEEAVRYLEQLGYHQYEISNFSKDGYESRHNLIYWHDEEYLGLGPSAHSFIDGKRFYYDNSFKMFYAGETIDEGPGGNENEYIMLALRLTEGLDLAKYEARYHKKLSDTTMLTARLLEKKGFLKISPTRIALTVKGFLVSNTVIGYLLQNT